MSLFSISDIKKIDNLVKKYVILEIKQEFLRIDIRDELNENEINYLIEKGMLLAKSNKNKNKERALKIATTLPLLFNNKYIILISNMILAELKNFVSLELIQKNNNMDDYKSYLSGIELLRSTYNEEENKVIINGEEVLLNDFQFKIYMNIKNYKNVSISAPTSVGKSFIVKRMISELLQHDSVRNIAYIVPTRALIKQVMDDIYEEISHIDSRNQYFLSCSSDISEIDKAKKGIFVLTQERLYQLCNNSDDFEISVMIIDEAQNIMSDSRGILLEYSIKYSKKLWSNLRLIFISPLINNPEKFIEEFKLEDSISEYEENYSVRQNLIILKKDHGGYKAFYEGDNLIGRFKAKKDGYASTIDLVYSNFNNGMNSIVYCNTPDLTRRVCAKLAENRLFTLLHTEELDEFAQFIEYYIDKKYELANYIRRGIAFHYSSLPTPIRYGIEELAVKGLLKIIACTPTLIEGVNIPAQNIYIIKPEKNDIPLTPLEFWNLTGRAGRMGKDFSGNIICIQRESWDENILNNRVSEIEFSTNTIFKENSDIIKQIINDRTNTEVNNDIFNHIESGLIFDKLIYKTKSKNHEKYIDKETELNLDEIITEFKPPKRLLIKLIGIKVEKIEKLWGFFLKNRNNIIKLLPKHPLAENSSERLAEIIEWINQIIMNNDLYSSESEKMKMVYMSQAWMRGEKLNKIIFYKFDTKANESKEITRKISSQIKYLEHNIRFKLVKGLYAYQEILKSFLEYFDMKKEVESFVNIPLYLELGASHNITVDLISAGIMRDLAIEITEVIPKHILNPIEYLRQANINEIELNQYLKNKLKKILETI